MLLEILFFLLPVAAFSGWLAGRRSRPPRSGDCVDLSADYFKGLNYLLNEQQDKAIEVFIRMVEVDSETVETHLALGSLFRRRGEVDRAIRIHQNLIARPILSRQQRELALYELGRDYMRAGLFDRAENLFRELVGSAGHSPPALRNLIDIYQQEKEWEKAVETARRLEAVEGAPLGPLIAQYYCEQAQQARSKGDVTQALKLLQKALSADRRCVRASLMEGEIHSGAGNYKAAVRALKRVEQQDADFLPEAIGPLQQCYQRMGRAEEMMEYLSELLARRGGISIMLAMADMIQRHRSQAAAAEFVTDYIRKRPSVRGMDRLIELSVLRAEASAQEQLGVLKELTERLLENRAVYECNQCGFSGKTLHWQCPSCKNWTTVKPIRGLEGE